MRNPLLLLLLALPSLLLLLLLPPSGGSSAPGPDYGSHPRFICTPLPAEADPSCFPTTTGPGAAGPGGPGGPGYQNAPPAGWWGASEEAKATILHQRESLVRQKETILDQRETIRELTAKLALCQGFGRGPHDERHHPAAGGPGGAGGHYPYTDHGHHGNNQQGHHGNSNLVPDSSHHPSVGGHRSDGGHGSSGSSSSGSSSSSSSSSQGKEKHVGDFSSSPEQMERMLQALKERLENLQKRNTSITYSSSLKELLQRKINALEEQLHHRGGGGHHDDHDDHDDDEHHHDDEHHNDDDEHHHDGDDEHHHDDDDDDEHHHGDHNDGHHDDHHGDQHGDDHHDTDGVHDDGDHHGDHDEEEDDRHGNDADSHSYFPHTGYTGPGHRGGFHSNKLEKVLNQLHFTGSKRKPMSPDAFQISFPMRSNYMYGRLKKTLLQEIFAFTLCLWMKAGAGPGLGTPFSYSAPGQANELVLIEWGNNPIELLVDDKAVTLPLSLSDGKWHHVCVTWSTRDGQWEAYQDGVQRGSGINLSPWRPIKPGGVFILGQEQDTLGGRFDAAQSYVGEMSDLHMWSHVLSAGDIYGLASCGSYLRGDIIAWADAEVELHGGVAKYPFDPCH